MKARGLRALGVIALLVAGAGCATLRPLTAGSGDLADYRSFRVAAAPGTRLARAQSYLERHPKGAFADEVRAAWEDEEPRYFVRAQASREGALRYLVDLPKGPHATAALALLTALGSSMHDAELADIAHAVAQDDVRLEAAAAQRRAIGGAILSAVDALLDENVYGVPRAGAPPALRTLMTGTDATWGGVSERRERDFFFSLPTRPIRQSRLFTLEIELREEHGLVVEGVVAGADMFVRWAEADQIVKLDAASSEDRTEAQVHAMARLAGALERRFPSRECPDSLRERELYHRACRGLEVQITPGSEQGARDVILVRRAAGPARTQGAR